MLVTKHPLVLCVCVCRSVHAWIRVCVCVLTHAVRAAPGALGGLLHVGVQAHHVVGSGARVAEDDLAALLTHLTVVLMVSLIAISILIHCKREREGGGGGERDKGRLGVQERRKRRRYG